MSSQEDLPSITDAEYDALRLRNQEIEDRFPSIIRPDSPSLRVGADVAHSVETGSVFGREDSPAARVSISAFEREQGDGEGEKGEGVVAPAQADAAARVRLPVVQHLQPLNSLDNVFTEEKATEFVERVRRAVDVATLGERGDGAPLSGSVESAKDARPRNIRESPHDGEAKRLASETDSAGAESEGREADMDMEDGRIAQSTPLPPLHFVAEPKIDGLTCALLYEDGRLVRAATRGDGAKGEDVTPNILALGETVVPQQLLPRATSMTTTTTTVSAEPVAVPSRFEVRGEVYMSDEAFARLNAEREAEGVPLFATARNAAAGSLRQLDADVSRGRGIRFFAYGAAVAGDIDGSEKGGGEEREGERRRQDAEGVHAGGPLAEVFGTQVSTTKQGRIDAPDSRSSYLHCCGSPRTMDIGLPRRRCCPPQWTARAIRVHDVSHCISCTLSWPLLSIVINGETGILE